MAGSRWVRLDVDYFRNPKALQAGRDGRALHLAAICYSGAQLTDGEIAGDAMRMVLGDAAVPRRAVDLCVEAGLLLPSERGFVVHDFTATNGTREEVLERIAAENARKARWRASRAGRNGHAT